MRSEGYGLCLCVTLCMCRRLFWHLRLRGDLWAIAELREPYIYPETTMFETHAVKTSIIALAYLILDLTARSVDLEAE